MPRKKDKPKKPKKYKGKKIDTKPKKTRIVDHEDYAGPLIIT